MAKKEEFKRTFKNYIEELTDIQLDIISKFSTKYNIGNDWWLYFKGKHLSDYCGDDFLNSLLENFIYYGIIGNIEKMILKYLPSEGKNIYGEAYIDIKIDNLSIKDDMFVLDEEENLEFEEFIMPLKLSQKLELMENKLFYDIITQTNINIYSKKDIRAIKLRELEK